MKVILVSAVALIDRDGRVLIAQRPKGKSMEGLWEFPGGKIESGETPEDALVIPPFIKFFWCCVSWSEIKF